MEAPRWFIRELKLIDPDLFPYFEWKSGRWIIMKRVPTIHGGISKPELAVSKGKEYTPLDGRVLNEIKELMYEKNKLKRMNQHLENLEKEDLSLVEGAEKAWQDAKRQFLKKLHRFMFIKIFT